MASEVKNRENIGGGEEKRWSFQHRGGTEKETRRHRKKIFRMQTRRRRWT